MDRNPKCIKMTLDILKKIIIVFDSIVAILGIINLVLSIIYLIDNGYSYLIVYFIHVSLFGTYFGIFYKKQFKERGFGIFIIKFISIIISSFYATIEYEKKEILDLLLSNLSLANYVVGIVGILYIETVYCAFKYCCCCVKEKEHYIDFQYSQQQPQFIIQPNLIPNTQNNQTPTYIDKPIDFTNQSNNVINNNDGMAAPIYYQ